MKKIIYGSVIILIPLLLGGWFSVSKMPNDRVDTINYKLQNKTYKLLIADTPEEWEKGLMFVKKKEGLDGMVFIFPEKDSRNFWNKNTLVDLDVYWLNDDKLVGKSSLPSIEKSKDIVTVRSPGAVNKVIEIIN